MNRQIFALCSLAMLFFASNSLLARLALIDDAMDPYSFTFYRLLFGALVLLVLIYLRERIIYISFKSNWNSSIMLFVYAMFFSLAYINLDAGIGALILFASVQLTILAISIIKKEKLTFIKAFGILTAFAGLFNLLIPKTEIEVPVYDSMLMAVAGIAWGFYTVLGRKQENSTYHTSDNFTKATLFALVAFIVFQDELQSSSYGIFLAFLSGGITSAIGYLLWYYLLPNLEVSTSGIIQLTVPPLTIVLGALFLDEIINGQVIGSTALVLFGIYLFMKVKKVTP